MKYLICFLLIINLAEAKRRVVLSQEDTKMLNEAKVSDFKKNEENEVKEEKEELSGTKKKEYKIYRPAPVVSESQRGFEIERDSTKIVTKYVSQADSLNVYICYSAGVTIALDESYNDEFQDAIIDDLIYFEAKEFENKKAVYVKLKQPIPENSHWESALRLVTKSNDKTFLVNLIGVSCPKKGTNPYPKVYYIKKKRMSKLFSATSKVMTPEDTIIYASEGLPRKNIYGIRVYDMVTAANSNWVVFGVEIQYPEEQKESKIQMKVLDNMQVSAIPVKYEMLDVSSKIATNEYGKPTLRFNVSVQIDKTYVIEDRYIYLMVLDKETKHYQYIEIDLLPYFMSLKNRGFNI